MPWNVLNVEELLDLWRQWLGVEKTDPKAANELMKRIVWEATRVSPAGRAHDDPLHMLCSEEKLRQRLTGESTPDPFAYALYKSAVWAFAQARHEYQEAFRWSPPPQAYAPTLMNAWDWLEAVCLPRLDAAISLDAEFELALQVLKEAKDLLAQCKQAARENWRTLRYCREKEHAALWADGIAADHDLVLKSVNRDSDEDVLGTTRVYENEEFVLEIECSRHGIYYGDAVCFCARVVRKSDGVIQDMPYRHKHHGAVHRQLWRESVRSFAEDVDEMFGFYRHYVKRPSSGRYEGVIHTWHRTYGFINTRWDENVFIHKSQIPGKYARKAPSGLIVRFTLENDLKGPRAADVEVIGHLAEYANTRIQRELHALRESSHQSEVETGNGGKEFV